MTHHHHDPGHAHPSPRLPPSLLRVSLPVRLAVVLAAAAAVWAMVLWAIA